MASAIARAIRISSSSSLLDVRSTAAGVTGTLPSSAVEAAGEAGEEPLAGTVEAILIIITVSLTAPTVGGESIIEVAVTMTVPVPVLVPVAVPAAPGATLAGAVFARARTGAEEEEEEDDDECIVVGVVVPGRSDVSLAARGGTTPAATPPLPRGGNKLLVVVAISVEANGGAEEEEGGESEEAKGETEDGGDSSSNGCGGVESTTAFASSSSLASVQRAVPAASPDCPVDEDKESSAVDINQSINQSINGRPNARAQEAKQNKEGIGTSGTALTREGPAALLRHRQAGRERRGAPNPRIVRKRCGTGSTWYLVRGRTQPGDPRVETNQRTCRVWPAHRGRSDIGREL